MNTDTLFTIWIRGSIALAAVFVVWNYVPILIPLGVVVGALVLFTVGVRWAARRYRKSDQTLD